MDPTLILLIVGAIASIVGTAVSTGVNAHNVRQTNQANKDIAAMQNQWNVEQWQRENQYNLPENQVARLSAAGINPALAMSQSGIVDAGNASQMHPAAGATMQPFQMENIGSSIGSSIQNIGLQQSQIDANNAYAENQKAEAAAARELLPEQLQQMQERTKEIQEGIKNLQKQQQVLSATVRNLDQDTAKKAFETSHTLYLENLYDKNYQLDLRKFNEHTLPLMRSELATQSIARIESMARARALDVRRAIDSTDLDYAQKTLAYRVLGTQTEFFIKDNELEIGKVTLARLGWDYETQQFNNPWATIFSSKSSAPQWIKSAAAGVKLGQSLLNGMLGTIQPALDRVSYKKIDINHSSSKK